MLSSHLVSDLERVCDHLILLAGSRVQLAGDIDTLLADHRRAERVEDVTLEELILTYMGTDAESAGHLIATAGEES
jgi:ABC-2 type transport system ATP-binding protein